MCVSGRNVFGPKEENSPPQEVSRFICFVQHVEGLADAGRFNSTRTQILSIFPFYPPYHTGLQHHACSLFVTGWLLPIQHHIHIPGGEEGEWVETKGDKCFLLVSLCLLFGKISLPRDFLLHILGQNMAPTW